MSIKLEDIIAEAVCRFNVGIDIDGQFTPAISTDTCENTCSYCKMFAQYICKRLEEGFDDDK